MNSIKFGHLTKKERERACLLCDSKCEAYLADGETHFTQLKGHKLQSAEKVWWDCRFYIWRGE